MYKFLLLFLMSCLIFPLFVSADLNPLLQSVSKYDQVIIEKVLEADLFLLKSGEKVQLIGLETPRYATKKEVNRDEHGFIIPDDDPTTPVDIEALRSVKDLVEKKAVRLEFDTQRRNDEGILLAYVFLADGKMVNEEALRYGYAQLGLRIPNMKYAQRLRNAYKESRREMRGIQGDW